MVVLILPRVGQLDGPAVTIRNLRDDAGDHVQVGVREVSGSLRDLYTVVEPPQSPKYQLRLYCTSSAYYTPPGQFRSPATTPCPIEFPPTCEVRVNGQALNANLKGLKKKPGTAPPPDIGKNVRQAQNASNRVEMIYVNSQQPTPAKVRPYSSFPIPCGSLPHAEILSCSNVG